MIIYGWERRIPDELEWNARGTWEQVPRGEARCRASWRSHCGCYRSSKGSTPLLLVSSLVMKITMEVNALVKITMAVKGRELEGLQSAFNTDSRCTHCLRRLAPDASRMVLQAFFMGNKYFLSNWKAGDGDL